MPTELQHDDILLKRLAQIAPGEGAALGWAFGYFFFLLSGYYVLRPLRDEMGIAGGVDKLPWMFTATFVAMLAAVPLYGWVATRQRVRRNSGSPSQLTGGFPVLMDTLPRPDN